ncbi:hypothetical protein BKI52_26515 [marine bacterium AO1-C]|nr:hypothetical protein BKI52_26515 [marine bacterium AO1-C]
MMEAFLVINYLVVEKELVLVGATDNQRWDWDIKEGYSGADAKTLVLVTLEGDLNSKYAIQEEAQFHCAPGDPLRKLAMNHLYELFEIAWKIKRGHLDKITARQLYMGFEIRDNID